jgi:predicted DNA-binding antitoxin AbrB/MazE fold protein
MTRTIEVVYEDNVFKPVGPVKGMKEHDRMVASFIRSPDKKGLQDLAGTLTHDEARAMQKLIDAEFETIEGTW